MASLRTTSAIPQHPPPRKPNPNPNQDALPSPIRFPQNSSPSELREQIFTLVLNFLPTIPTSCCHRHCPPRAPLNLFVNSSQWLHDHKRLLGRDFIWPPIPPRRHQPALTATLPPGNARRTDSRLALALVCRQLYRESYHLYYTRNRFSLASMSELLRIRRDIGRTQRQLLRSVRLSDWAGPFSTDYERAERMVGFLTECESLRELRIQVDSGNERFLGPVQELRGLRLEVVEIGPSPWLGKRWVGDEIGAMEKERVVREMEELSGYLRQHRRIKEVS